MSRVWDYYNEEEGDEDTAYWEALYQEFLRYNEIAYNYVRV